MIHDGTTTQYFAYGSNLSSAQMTSRCPSAQNPYRAKLPGFRFIINSRGVATLVPHPEGETHGVVWEISMLDLSMLDKFEGVGKHLYRRDERTVFGAANNEPALAWVYLAADTTPGSPRKGYIERVIIGAIEHDLDKSQIERISEWRMSDDTDAVG
jgi:gamma-glutamylcyclotransferase (GGCT)/AIG2-like uncharacterized protein YtfP